MKCSKSKLTNDNSMSQKIIIILLIVALIAILVPVAVNLLLYLPIPTPSDLSNREWLSFWGSYLGGCLGGICTLITIFVTIRYYEKQDKAHKEELDEQNRKHAEEMQDNIIRRYRPLLILQPNGGSGSNGRYNPFSLHVHNVSEFAAVNVKVNDKYEPLMEAKTEIVFSLKSNNPQGGYNDTVEVWASDVIGNSYKWTYQLMNISDITNSNGSAMERYYYKIISEERSWEADECLKQNLSDC